MGIRRGFDEKKTFSRFRAGRVSSSTPVAPNVAGGKPAWMLELEAKKRAKAASERQVG